ncbi:MULTISPECIES: LuxR C-terminal-related transcriptional regulator [unclassified Blastococcus]
MPPDMAAIRVFLVDPHEVSRRGLGAVLAADPQLRVVGEADSAVQAQRRVLAARPDVAVVADARLCRHLRAVLPGLRCLVLGQDGSADEAHAARRAGADGYVGKHVRGEQLATAMRRVAAGQSLFDAATIAPARPGSDREDRLARLTHRERQVLELLGEALSNREIAERLRLEVKSVKNYVTTLLRKLDLTNRTQAAVLVTELRTGDGATGP